MSDYYEEDEGIHFDPEDDELINEYLIPKLGGDLHDDFIVHKNVYAMEPWLLDHTMDPFFQKNEWYYFVTRTQVSEKNIGCGKKAKRKISGDNNDGIEHGNWKANATANIIDQNTGKIIGVKQTLTYTRSNNNKKQKRGDGTCVIVPGSDSSWIMTEYMLPEGENFQELVLCKIKKFKKKDDHHEASTSYHHHESFSSEQQMISDHDYGLASSSKQEQPLLCGPEIPRVASPSSLTFPAAETYNNIEQSGEGNFVSLSETVSKGSSKKDEQFKDIEVTHELGEDWIRDFMDKYWEKELEEVPMINTEDQQPRPISAHAHMNFPFARSGDKSLPIKLDDNSNEDEEWDQAVECSAILALTQDEEDVPNLQWMDQGY